MQTLMLLLLAQAAAGETEPLGHFDLAYEASYVGSERCGACHEDVFHQQATHHMAQTARAPAANDPLFESPPESFVRTELGAVFGIGQESRPVAALLGSGVHGVTPISAETGRAIRELSLSYSQVLGSWFPTPGADGSDDPLGPVKTPEESLDCLTCHATTAVWDGDGWDAGASMLGVQCERCHGPGSMHLEAVARGATDTRILNPARFAASDEVRFCAQCHRQPNDLEPLEVLGRAPTLARHAGAGLMMSACFRQSPQDSAIACTRCHDPHRNVEPSDTATYRTECLRCHTDPADDHAYETVTATSDCIGCHMPVEKQGFHGMTFTDHWIRIPGTPPPLGTDRERDALDYLEILYRNAWEDEHAGPERRTRLAIGLSEVLLGLGRVESAYEWLGTSLEHGPKTQHRLKAAAMLRQGARLDEAQAVLEEAVRIDPLLVRAHFDLGELARQRSRDEDALAHYERAIAIRNDFADAHAGLGTSLRFLDRLDDAYRHFDEAERLTPGRPLVLSGIAWVLAVHPDPARRDPARSVALAERAASDTGYLHPLVLDSLAAAYAAAGDFETAVNAATRAIELARAGGAGARIAPMEKRLALYRSGNAYTAPP